MYEKFTVINVLGALAASAPIIAGNTRELGRTKPFERSAAPVIDTLADELDNRVKQLSPGRRSPEVLITENIPAGFIDAYRNPNRFASVKSYKDTKDPTRSVSEININPNADRAYLAHELGHIASRHTDIGHFVSNMRHSPKLKRALGISMLGIPALASALEEGYDDLDTSIVTALAAASPTLIDEALASKNALAMMDTSGMRATLGQRGKLAGGLLSYMAVPVIAATVANTAGNAPEYFNAINQTSGELNPQ